MDGERLSNYELTKLRMQREFALNDMRQIAETWQLPYSGEALHVELVSRMYSIDSHTGAVTICADGREQGADHNVAMTLFDILTRPRVYAFGRYSPVQSFSTIFSGTAPGSNMFGRYEELFDNRGNDLKKACRQLGGTEFGRGDVGMKIPAFRDLDIVLQFWNSDEEFGPSLSLLCDDNIISFMHYETVFYLLFHILGRIEQEMTKEV